MKGLLQDEDDNEKATSEICTIITQRHIGVNRNEGSHTCTGTGGNIEGPTSAAKDDGKAGTTCLERLLQLERTFMLDKLKYCGHIRGGSGYLAIGSSWKQFPAEAATHD